MNQELIDSIQELIEKGKGDSSRLQYIIGAIKEGKKLYDSDQKYVDSLIESKSTSDNTIETKQEKSVEYHPDDEFSKMKQDLMKKL